MPVWDLPLRVFHLLLIGAMVAAYASGSAGGLWLPWHSRVGEFIVALLVFRLVWGFIGSTYSRFASFLPTPARWLDSMVSFPRR